MTGWGAPAGDLGTRSREVFTPLGDPQVRLGML